MQRIHLLDEANVLQLEYVSASGDKRLVHRWSVLVSVVGHEKKTRHGSTLKGGWGSLSNMRDPPLFVAMQQHP